MRAFISVLAIGAMLGAVAGCGGGSSSGGTGGGGGGNPTTVTVKVGSASAVATQIGTGAFTAATPTSGTVTLTVPFGTSNFAVASACSQVTTNNGITFTVIEENVLEASTLDGTSFSLACPLAPAAGTTGTLTGSVDASAIAGANYVGVSAASGVGFMNKLIAGVSSNFSVDLPSGSDRVAVMGYIASPGNQPGVNSVYTLAAVRNFASVTVPGQLNGGNTVVLGTSDAVTMQPITYSNAPAGYSAPSTLADYSWGGVSPGAILLSDAATSQYPAVPAAAAESGDLYQFVSRVESTTGNLSQGGLYQTVWVNTWATSGAPLTVNFPAAWNFAGLTPASLPVIPVAYSGYNGSSNVTYDATITWLPATAVNVIRRVTATEGHLGGSTSLAIPDLSAVAGFAAAPASGAIVGWSAQINQTSFPSFGGVPASGGTASFVTSSGTYTVP